jgi:hypothetical protein
MLMPDERALLVMYCNNHPVAVCPQCSEALVFNQMGADIFMGKRDFCPMCRADLTTSLRQHLAECSLMRIQERETRDRARQEAQGAAPNGSNSPDETRKAVQESERLREEGEEAIDEALRIGSDYIPIKDRRPPHDQFDESHDLLTAPTTDGMIPRNEFGEPCTPGRAGPTP